LIGIEGIGKNKTQAMEFKTQNIQNEGTKVMKNISSPDEDIDEEEED
jgi:hypothetical protein